MAENKGKHIIQALQKKWQLQWLLSYAIVCLSILVVAAIIIHKFLPESLLGIFMFSGITSVLVISIILPDKFHKLKTATVTNYLNQTFPVLEESTDLLLQPSSNLNLFATITSRKD